MSSTHICPNCGARQRRSDARFCQNCGHPLSAATQPISPEVAGDLPDTTHKTSPWFWIILIAILGVVAVAILYIAGTEKNLLRDLSDRPEVALPPISTPTVILVTITDIPPRKRISTPCPTSTLLPTATTAPTPTKKSTPVNTSIPRSSGPSEEEKIRQLMQQYRKVKVESLTHWDTSRLDEVLSYPVIERQKRGICGLRKAGQHYEYSNREFRIDELTFTDENHATVLARIQENRVLKKRNGDVIHDYGHEDYRAVFKLERSPAGRWKIYCFQALDDDEPVSCKAVIPKENPCTP